MIQNSAFGCTLSVVVTPKSSKNEIVEIVNEELKVRINASPEGGKANKTLVAFLAKSLKIKKDDIEISRGHTSRHKLLKIKGQHGKEVAEKIGAVLSKK